MPRRYRVLVLLAVLLTGQVLPSTSRTAEPKARPSTWASKLERPGLPNLHKIDDGLYRGAQPAPEGIKELEKLGIKTIIGLRSNHSDKEILGNSPITYEAIPMAAWAPKEADLVRFLQIVTDKNRQPVFVHCQHGADRTGAMCAAYRVVVGGWTKQQAIDEMTQGGFDYHTIWTNLITFVNGLDVEKIKNKAGLTK
jgi:protein tyrosine/serine phosphatase